MHSPTSTLPSDKMTGRQINEALRKGLVVETFRVGINEWVPLNSSIDKRVTWPDYLELTARIVGENPEISGDVPSSSMTAASVWSWTTRPLPRWLKQSPPLRFASEKIGTFSTLS